MKRNVGFCRRFATTLILATLALAGCHTASTPPNQSPGEFFARLFSGRHSLRGHISTNVRDYGAREEESERDPEPLLSADHPEERKSERHTGYGAKQVNGSSPKMVG